MSVDYQKNNTLGVAGTDSDETVPVNPESGQIIFDQEQVFVQLIIKSAVDIDDATGITNKQVTLLNGRKTDSTFSGVYKVLKVKSDFNRGKFEQTLELIKMPNDIFLDDAPKVNPKVELKAAVAQTETTTASPSPAPATDQVVDSTGNSAADTAKLKEAAAQSPTNPVPSSPGEGKVAVASQPTEAAPSNANDAVAIAPQEKAAADPKALFDQNEAAINELVEKRATEIPAFNAELSRIRNDNTLSASEKADKVIALREELQATLKAQADQIVQLSLTTYKAQSETGTDQSLRQLKLLTRLSSLQKQTTEFFQAQTERIAKVKETGIA